MEKEKDMKKKQQKIVVFSAPMPRSPSRRRGEEIKRIPPLCFAACPDARRGRRIRFVELPPSPCVWIAAAFR